MIQSILIHQALRQLPRVFDAMQRADAFERDQIIYRAFREIVNSSPFLDDMNQEQKEALDAQLIEIFKNNKWIA